MKPASGTRLMLRWPQVAFGRRLDTAESLFSLAGSILHRSCHRKRGGNQGSRCKTALPLFPATRNLTARWPTGDGGDLYKEKSWLGGLPSLFSSFTTSARSLFLSGVFKAVDSCCTGRKDNALAVFHFLRSPSLSRSLELAPPPPRATPFSSPPFRLFVQPLAHFLKELYLPSNGLEPLSRDTALIPRSACQRVDRTA